MATVSEIAKVRLRIGDRGNSPQFSDAEIGVEIDEAGSWKRACLILVKSQIAELAAQPDFGGGALRLSHSNRLAVLKKLLNDLRSEFKMWDEAGQSKSILLKGGEVR